MNLHACAEFGPDRTTGGDVYMPRRIHTQTDTVSYIDIDVNDIANVSSLLRFVLFADDTNIFLSGDDAKEINNTLSIELDKLNSWFAVNKLSLNVSKTNYMIFGNKKIDKDMNIRVGINGISIDRVYNTTFLGVTIDDKLNWKEHIKMIQSKLSKTTAIIYKASHVLTERALYILYCSLALP